MTSSSPPARPSPSRPERFVLDRRDQLQFSAVEDYAVAHLNQQHSSLSAHLALADTACNAAGLPDWSAIPTQGKFVKLQCQMLGVKNMLEIGTFGGHSAIWCASADPDLRITTIELDEAYAEVSRRNFEAAGIAHRIELLVGRAQDLLPRLLEEVGNGRRARYGLYSIDVEVMEQTWELLDLGLGLCERKACIIAHCALRISNLHVSTADEEEARVRGSRELIERAGRDARLDGVVLMTVGRQYYDTFVGIAHP